MCGTTSKIKPFEQQVCRCPTLFQECVPEISEANSKYVCSYIRNIEYQAAIKSILLLKNFG